MYRPLLVERLGCDEVLRDINSSPPRGRILNEKLAAMGRVASSFCAVIRPISSGPQVTPLVSKLSSGFSMTHRRKGRTLVANDVMRKADGAWKAHGNS
jgi:hypothetical protein